MDFISDDEYRQMDSQSKSNKINDLLLRVSRIEQAIELLGEATGIDVLQILDPVDLDSLSLKDLMD